MKKLVATLFFAFLLFTYTGKAHAQDSATVIFDAGNARLTAGSSVKVNVFIDSNVLVNAAQLSITYPQTNFSLLSIDSTGSEYSIKAEETAKPGLIKIARGNITALTGKRLFTALNLKVLRNSASITQLGYLSADSLVMSLNSTNVLVGSQVIAQKPPEHDSPGINVPLPHGQTNKVSSRGLFTIFKEAVSEFFSNLFGKH